MGPIVSTIPSPKAVDYSIDYIFPRFEEKIGERRSIVSLNFLTVFEHTRLVFLDEPRSRLARPTFFHLVLSRMRPERDSDRFHRLDKAFDFSFLGDNY